MTATKLPSREGAISFVPVTSVSPPVRSVSIDRPKLQAMLDRIDSSRLTTICAPPGSGKTMAASQWFRCLRSRGRPGLWLAGRAGINTLDSLLRTLGKAAAAAGLPWQGSDTANDAARCISALCSHAGTRPVLVIDDAQYLDDESLAFISQLIATGRSALTTILVSRGATPIPVARLRALALLTEIGLEDLQFDTIEAHQLICRIAETSLDESVTEPILRDTRGWAAGLVIAATHCRQQRDPKPPAPSREVAPHIDFIRYFNEEILDLQDSTLREFLEETSVLDQLTPALCAAATRSTEPHARRMLATAWKAGLFLTAVDPLRDVYEHHLLFRRCLATQLECRSPDRAAQIHRRVSLYYATIGDALNALAHAELSGQPEFLADQLDSLANELTYSGYLYRICELSAKLPWSIISSRPLLLLALAWRKIRQLAYASAQRFIDAAAEISASRPGDVMLAHLVQHRRILLDAARDNMRAVEAQAPDLLCALGTDAPYVSCTLLAQLMSARRELYHFHDILKLEAETHRVLRTLGTQFGSIALKSTVAPTLVVQGKTALARRFLEESLATAEAREGQGSGLAGLPALPLAELLYDLGELQMATTLVDCYLPTARHWGFVDQLASGYLVKARLAVTRGDSAAALVYLDEAHLVAIECGLDRLRVFVMAEQVRILTRLGKIPEAEAALRAAGLRFDTEPLPGADVTRKDEFAAAAWLRVEMHSPRVARAEKVALRWLDFLKRSAALRSIVIFHLLLAEIAVLRGDRPKAQRSVRKAVELAEPAGWTEVFKDEGEVITTLLQEAYGNDAGIDTAPADAFACRLVTRAPTRNRVRDYGRTEDSTVAASAKLSGREIEILDMVRGGLRNREIGTRLGITEGTVKWYMQQIYDKLGVRRRSQASLRARQSGTTN